MSKEITFSNTDFVFMMEEPETGIYVDVEKTEKINEIRDYNYHIVKIISTSKDQSNLALIEYNNVLVGWVELKDSLPLYNKKLEKVEIDIEKFKSTELNKLINDDRDFNLYFKNYQIQSRFYLFYEDEIYEAIYRKKQFIAFAPSYSVTRMFKLNNLETTFISDDIKLYATSKMDETINSDELNIHEPVFVTSIFPELNRAKIVQEETTGWIDVSALAAFEYPENNIVDLDSIYQSHIENQFINEELVVKSLITKLLNENIALERKLLKTKQDNVSTQERLDNLKNSKLGRLQIAIWERRAKRGNKR